MKRYYFDADMRGDPKPVECAEGGLVYFEEANARIAELTAEVDRYKAAMQSIVDDYKKAFHTDWTTAANYAEIARNALKEGKS